MTILRVQNISKTYEMLQALNRISFDMQASEILSLLGPSGCGKSTLLNIIAGLEKPDQGQISWNGKSYDGIPPHERGFGLMFQDFALFPHLNVFDNVAFGLRMMRKDKIQLEARVNQVLELVGLGGFEKRDIHTLSGGEAQRIALARSLAPEPCFLMLDEPLGSLDRTLRERLVLDLGSILRDLRQTAIYVTHDQEEAFSLADRVIVMNAGKIEQIGTPQDIYQDPATPFVATFLGFRNLIAGTIRDNLQGPQIETMLGSFPSPVAASGPAMMLLRPDAVAINGEGSLQLTGIVRERIFRGAVSRVGVEVQGKALEFTFPIQIQIPEPGAPIQLSFSADQAIHVFKSV